MTEKHSNTSVVAGFVSSGALRRVATVTRRSDVVPTSPRDVSKSTDRDSDVTKMLGTVSVDATRPLLAPTSPRLERVVRVSPPSHDRVTLTRGLTTEGLDAAPARRLGHDACVSLSTSSLPRIGLALYARSTPLDVGRRRRKKSATVFIRASRFPAPVFGGDPLTAFARRSLGFFRKHGVVVRSLS